MACRLAEVCTECSVLIIQPTLLQLLIADLLRTSSLEQAQRSFLMRSACEIPTATAAARPARTAPQRMRPYVQQKVRLNIEGVAEKVRTPPCGSSLQ